MVDFSMVRIWFSIDGGGKSVADEGVGEGSEGVG